MTAALVWRGRVRDRWLYEFDLHGFGVMGEWVAWEMYSFAWDAEIGHNPPRNVDMMS